MRHAVMIAIAWLMVLPGLGAAEPINVDPDTDPPIEIDPDDREMNAARARAIAELPHFYSRLASPAADESGFMIKFDILAGVGDEFVWATDLERSGDQLTGILINQPVHRRERLGDRVPIDDAAIIDWGYFRGKVLQGAYTNRVLVDRLPPEEAAEMRRSLGW